MNRHKCLLLAVVAAVAWGTAGAAPSGGQDQPHSAAAAKQAQQQPKGESHWNDHFQGSGNVTQTRCLGMSRGPNCITAGTRKDAARRAAAGRAAAAEAAEANAEQGGAE